MLDAIYFVFDFFTDIIELLSFYYFEIGGMAISLFDIMIGAVVLSMIITVFWKGARG